MKRSAQIAITVALMIAAALIATIIIARAGDADVPSLQECRKMLEDQAPETPTEMACIKRYGEDAIYDCETIRANAPRPYNGPVRGCRENLVEKPTASSWRPWQRVWQCNDIRVTETSIRSGVINYDLAGTIWGGSQFTYDLNHEKIYFNGRACLPVR